VGLPIIAYNNPHDYKVDLTPDILSLACCTQCTACLVDGAAEPTTTGTRPAAASMTVWFTTELEVDHKRLTELCEHLIASGISGLVPTGSLVINGRQRHDTRCPGILGMLHPMYRLFSGWSSRAD
jgi:hypothetical protein